MICAQSCLDESTDSAKFDCMVECLQDGGFEEEISSRRHLAGGGHGGAYIRPYVRPYYGGSYRPYVRPYIRPYVYPHYGGYRRPWGGFYGRAPYLRGGFHHRRLAQVDQEIDDVSLYNVTSICLTYCDSELPGLIADDLNLTLEQRENITDFFDLEDQGICLSSCVFSLLEDPDADYTVDQEYKPKTVQCLVGCADVQDSVVQERLETFAEEHPEMDFSEVDIENLEVEYCFLQCLNPNTTQMETTETENTDISGRRRMAGGGGFRGGYGRHSGYRRYGGYYGGGAYIRRPYVQPYYRTGAYVQPYYGGSYAVGAYRPWGGYRRGYYGGYRRGGYRGWH